MREWLSIVFVLIANSPLDALAQRPTPDFYKCVNRVDGEWLFGQAPSGCDASSFGPDTQVLRRYGELIFHEGRNERVETARYSTALAAVLRDAAGAYLRRRKPNASPVERVVFRRMLFAVAHQESYWSHYRRARDGKLKLMRGDFGHGHGLMQIDDRWHFVKVDRGEAWDLVSNLLHSLELIFAEWERAAEAPCVPNPEAFEARVRATYSAYNGGSGQACRWRNSKSPWRRNDIGFLEKFRGLAWLAHVGDEAAAAPFDVACAMESGRKCVPGSEDWGFPRELEDGSAAGDLQLLDPNRPRSDADERVLDAAQRSKILEELSHLEKCFQSENCASHVSRVCSASRLGACAESGLSEIDPRAEHFAHVDRVKELLRILTEDLNRSSLKRPAADAEAKGVARVWSRAADDGIRERSLELLLAAGESDGDAFVVLLKALETSHSGPFWSAALPVLGRFAEGSPTRLALFAEALERTLLQGGVRAAQAIVSRAVEIAGAPSRRAVRERLVATARRLPTQSGIRSRLEAELRRLDESTLGTR